MKDNYRISLVGENIAKVIREDKRHLIEDNRLVLGEVADDGVYRTPLGVISVQQQDVFTVRTGRVQSMVITSKIEGKIYELRGYRRRDIREIEICKHTGYGKQDVRKGLRLEVEKIDMQADIFVANGQKN